MIQGTYIRPGQSGGTYIYPGSRGGTYIRPPFAMSGLGADAPDAAPSVLEQIWPWFSLAGALTGAYHGYKRNQSIGWALGWGILGSMLPIFTIPLSLAQGFGERKKG
jgi:hypothetical protein